MSPFVYLFLVTMVVAGVHIKEYTQFSPIDELRHVDYAMRVTRFHIPKFGDLLSQESMREEACRGVDIPVDEPPCNMKVFNPLGFRDGGYQVASAHPATYYLGAGWFARIAVALGISNSFVDPARIFSALVTAAGLMVAFSAGRMAGLRAPPLLGALTLVLTMPAVLHASSTVNPDSMAIVAGAVVMLVGLAWERGRVPLWALAIAGAFATGTKFTSLLAVLVMAGVFLVRARPLRLLRARRAARAESTPAPTMPGEPVVSAPGVEIPARAPLAYLKAAAVLLGSALLVAMVWAAFDRMRAVVDPSVIPQNQFLASHGFPPLASLFSPIDLYTWIPPWNSYDPVRFVTPYVLDVRVMMTYLFAGATLMAALRVSRRDTMSLFGVFGVAASLLGAPAFILFTAATAKVLVNPEARYGMSLIPFMAALLASFVKGRFGVSLLWFFASVSIGIVVGSMLVSTPV